MTFLKEIVYNKNDKNVRYDRDINGMYKGGIIDEDKH